MAIQKEGNDCMVTAVTLALGKPELSESLWALRAVQKDSGQAISTEPEMEAINLAKLFQAAGEPATIVPVKIRSLKDLTAFPRKDQLFVGLPRQITGKPHLMYIGEVGDGEVLSRKLIEAQLPANLVSRFTIDLTVLALSKDGLQTFIRRR